MSLKILFNISTSKCIRVQNILSKRCLASFFTQKDDTAVKDEKLVYETADEKPAYEMEDIEMNEEIQKMRNKSRLLSHHRNIHHKRIPYEEPVEWFHHTVKYKKRMLGKYGMEAVKTPAGFAWPTREEVEDMKEYERLAYPYSIREEWARIEETNKNKAEAIKAREAEISAKMIEMDKWVKELNARIAKKEADTLAAKRLRERLIEEVRAELGHNISIHHDKFKEALALKEKRFKQKQKESKKKAREEKMLKLQDSTQINEGASTPSLDESVK